MRLNIKKTILGANVVIWPEKGAECCGIGGWLLLLCLGLLAVIPFTALVDTYYFTKLWLEKGFRFPLTFLISSVQLMMQLGLASFGVYTGLALWRLKPGAVSLTKLFLLASLLIPFLQVPLSLMTYFELNEIILFNLKDHFLNLWGPTLFFVVWYIYLSRSKRVEATYDMPG